MYPSLINSFAIFISLTTATGIFLHDTRIDKATSVAALPVASISSDTGAKMVHIGPNDFHNHIERGSVARAVGILNSSVPGIAPRISEDKKHLMQRYSGRGHHPFDNYNLPIL